MEFFEASEEGTLYVRERRSRRQIRADVDDVPPVDAHDHRWSGRLDEPCDIADVDDRAVPGADRDRGDRGERVLGRLRVRYEHVFEPVRSGELRRQVAAERGANGGRRRPDAGIECTGAITVEDDVELRGISGTRRRDVDR